MIRSAARSGHDQILIGDGTPGRPSNSSIPFCPNPFDQYPHTRLDSLLSPSLLAAGIAGIKLLKTR
jgi:hypothetical protein